MGHVRADLRAAADAARRQAGGDAGRLPRRRLADELGLAAERVLRADRFVRRQIPEGRRRRHRGGADAAVRGGVVLPVADPARFLADGRTPVGDIGRVPAWARDVTTEALWA